MWDDYVKDDEISGKMLNESREVNDSRRHGQDKGVERLSAWFIVWTMPLCSGIWNVRPTFQSSGEFIEKQGLKRFGHEEHHMVDFCVLIFQTAMINPCQRQYFCPLNITCDYHRSYDPGYPWRTDCSESSD